MAPILLIVGWISVQLVRGLTFEFQPQAVEAAVSGWPKDVPLSVGKSGTIVLFLHPHCPCSRATITQLDRLCTIAAHDKVAVHIVFVGTTADELTGLTKAAESLPGVQTHFDSSRALARRFSASVSGETFAFDGQHKLIFHGGLTSARGHAGDSYALTALADWLRDGVLPAASSARRFPTFGCRL